MRSLKIHAKAIEDHHLLQQLQKHTTRPTQGAFF